MVSINPRTVIALMKPTSGAKFELYPLYARCRSLFSTVFFSSWISHFFHFEKPPSLRRAEHSRLFRRANTTIAPLRRRSSDSESDEDGTTYSSVESFRGRRAKEYRFGQLKRKALEATKADEIFYLTGKQDVGYRAILEPDSPRFLSGVEARNLFVGISKSVLPLHFAPVRDGVRPSTVRR